MVYLCGGGVIVCNAPQKESSYTKHVCAHLLRVLKQCRDGAFVRGHVTFNPRR